MYSFPRAVVIKYHKPPGGLKQQKFSHSSGDWKFEIEMVAELAPFEGFEGETVSCLSPSCWCWQAILGVPRLGDVSLQGQPPSSHYVLCLCAFTWLSYVSLYRTQVIRQQGSILLLFILTNYTCNNPIFKQGHILKYWGLGLQHISFFGGARERIEFNS